MNVLLQFFNSAEKKPLMREKKTESEGAENGEEKSKKSAGKGSEKAEKAAPTNKSNERKGQVKRRDNNVGATASSSQKDEEDSAKEKGLKRMAEKGSEKKATERGAKYVR